MCRLSALCIWYGCQQLVEDLQGTLLILPLNEGILQKTALALGLNLLRARHNQIENLKQVLYEQIV